MTPAAADSLRARWKLSTVPMFHAGNMRQLRLTLMQRDFSRLIFKREIGCDTYRQDADNAVDSTFRKPCRVKINNPKLSGQCIPKPQGGRVFFHKSEWPGAQRRRRALHSRPVRVSMMKIAAAAAIMAAVMARNGTRRCLTFHLRYGLLHSAWLVRVRGGRLSRIMT